MKKHEKKARRLRHRQIPPMPPPPKWDGRNEFDPITCTPDGSTIWHDYGGVHGKHRRIVVTRAGESPRDVVARENEKYLLCVCGCGRFVQEKGGVIEGHPRPEEKRRG